jgi:serine protease Do
MDRGQGTGVILAPDGYVLTNAHVVQAHGELPLRVRVQGKGSLKAERVGVDERTDLAVLRVDARGLVNLSLADDRPLQVGELVVAIGNPFRFEGSVSLGVVSALDRSLPGRTAGLEGLVQTDAAINPGNSGGPLVDVEGRVVGINTAIIPFAQGIGFAIPAHTASWVAAVLMAQGEVQRPYLGIAARGEELEAELSQATGQRRAIRVLEVGAATPADVSGLRAGDLLVAANGNPVATVDDLQRVMVLGPHRDVELEVFRGSQRWELRVSPKAFKAAA